MRYPLKHIDIPSLREWLRYDPKTGQLSLKKPTARLAKGHIFSSCYPDIYIWVSVGGHKHPAHRIAWALKTGKQPNIIDHWNGSKHDNRWTNLRNGTQQQNCLNRRSHRNARGETD